MKNKNWLFGALAAALVLLPKGKKKSTKISSVDQSGINFIKLNEGCVLNAYQDSSGVWTIGYGHTGNVNPNAHITKEDAEKLLKQDIQKITTQLNYWLNEFDITLNQNQYNAVVDFMFNIGRTAFFNSTMAQLLQQKKYDEAAKEFLRWVYSNHQYMPGLYARRLREKNLYEGQV